MWLARDCGQATRVHFAGSATDSCHVPLNSRTVTRLQHVFYYNLLATKVRDYHYIIYWYNQYLHWFYTHKVQRKMLLKYEQYFSNWYSYYIYTYYIIYNYIYIYLLIKIIGAVPEIRNETWVMYICTWRLRQTNKKIQYPEQQKCFMENQDSRRLAVKHLKIMLNLIANSEQRLAYLALRYYLQIDSYTQVSKFI